MQMNSTLAKIYILIMLECRLPLEEASKIFRVPKEALEEEIKIKRSFYMPFDYLKVECARYPEGTAKAKWKAELYYRRLQKILRVQDKDERVKLLNDFIMSLSGPNITFTIDKNQKYTEEEKVAIMKYRIKYAASGHEMRDDYHISDQTLAIWEEELPDDSELKIRLRILREYLNYCYQKKHLNNKR